MSDYFKTEVQNQLKSLKDIKSIDDLDFEKLELIRGETPQDIKEKCLQLCRNYLSDFWCQQTVDTIQISRVTGGLINQLYICRIIEQDNSRDGPQEVIVRLYMSNFIDSADGDRTRDVVIALMFSENHLGPKIYGLFDEGQIQKFYQHRLFKNREQNNPVLVHEVFKTLAKIHSMKVPIKNEPNWMFELMIKSYEEAVNRFPINEFIEEYNCETLKKYDLMTEINWIKDMIERANSPVLFTHNDFRSSNLLIIEPNDELVVCDFDMSRYGYRGSDFVALMREWGRKPFEYRTIEGLLLESQFRPLIEIYVEECQRIYGKSYSENEINSVDHILKEVKTFLLFSYLFSTLFYLKDKEGDIDFLPTRRLIMDFSELNYKNYFLIKDILAKQKIFA